MGPAAVIGIQQMFSRERRAAIKQRAKVMGRMVMLLTDGLCTKSYDQFVESYSNPGDEPDETARNARISRFAMRFSPTCGTRQRHRCTRTHNLGFSSRAVATIVALS